MTKRSTIHDVARAAKVSAATVSKVLNGVQSVKPENVQRIRTAITQLEYERDPVAADLRQGKRRFIAAIVPELDAPFFGALVSEIEDAADAAGYRVIFSTSREDEKRELDVIRRMHQWRVAGAIVVPVNSEQGRGAQLLDELMLPSVLVDRVSMSKRFDTVSADNYQASAQVANHLIEQGHTRFLLHSASPTSRAINARCDGFAQSVLRLNSDATVQTLLHDASVTCQRERLAQFLDHTDSGHRPQAVFSLSEHSTLVALSEMRRRKLSIPNEIALAGFDDAVWMRTTWPSITAVSQPVERMARQAVSTLLTAIDNGGDSFRVQHLERCALHIRESTKLTGEHSVLAQSMDTQCT